MLNPKSTITYLYICYKIGTLIFLDQVSYNIGSSLARGRMYSCFMLNYRNRFDITRIDNTNSLRLQMRIIFVRRIRYVKFYNFIINID